MSDAAHESEERLRTAAKAFAFTENNRLAALHASRFSSKKYTRFLKARDAAQTELVLAAVLYAKANP